MLPKAVLDLLSDAELLCYEGKFEDIGYDSITELLTADADKLAKICLNVGMTSKLAHVDRLREAIARANTLFFLFLLMNL